MRRPVRCLPPHCQEHGRPREGDREGNSQRGLRPHGADGGSLPAQAAVVNAAQAASLTAVNPQGLDPSSAGIPPPPLSPTSMLPFFASCSGGSGGDDGDGTGTSMEPTEIFDAADGGNAHGKTTTGGWDFQVQVLFHRKLAEKLSVPVIRQG